MEPLSTLAIGIDLDFVSTAEGGRTTPLLGGADPENRFTYRPNWGLPGWPDGDQTGAPVLGFAKADVEPGESTRAVIVPMFFEQVPAWLDVQPGDVLRMYEGSRICGRATVRWIEQATWRMPEAEQERFARWLLAPEV
ncbi:hypothetical protein [Nocardioides sp. Root190]|uniref:hypothetical protein n=1 Tax=Nocardioides sp. Root190 TaxID=1736488 RepID=UPI000B2541D0|nr:hypothetical protein [Nocardioides sp. Root190]